MELDNRRDLYAFLQEIPGAHFSEIQRQLDLATGTLQYHLRYLEKRGLVEVKRDGRYTRYYPSMEVDRRDKRLLGLLRQPTPRSIVLDLLEHGPSRLSHVAERLDLAPSTLSFHLDKLREADVVVRPERGVYEVADEQRVADVLVSYKESFVDRAVDRVAGLFTSLDPDPEESEHR